MHAVLGTSEGLTLPHPTHRKWLDSQADELRGAGLCTAAIGACDAAEVTHVRLKGLFLVGTTFDVVEEVSGETSSCPLAVIVDGG